MSIIFRKLEVADSILYRNIRLKCLQTFPDNFGSTFEEESKIEKLKFEVFLKEENADNFMFGAFDGEKLIGICGFSRELRAKTEHRGEIVQMFVDPQYTSKNIGFELLQKTIEKAFKNAAIEQIVLSVVAENKAANRLYEKLGFIEYGLLKNYFKKDEIYWRQRFMVLNRKYEI